MNTQNKPDAFQNLLTFEQIVETLTNTIDSKHVHHVALAGVDSRSGTHDICASLVKTLALSHSRVLLVTVENDGKTALSSLPGMDKRFEQVIKSAQDHKEGGIITTEIYTQELPHPASPQEARLQNIMKALEDVYDVIVWDLPPTDKAVQSRMVAQFTQGVVLVVEAGKTRWQSAHHAMEHFKYSGAQILGIILNNKKNYIPDWLYRLLFRDI
ncbi:MAG: hypothetical protein R3E13_00155 [Alphaproteobacteria bacterium]